MVSALLDLVPRALARLVVLAALVGVSACGESAPNDCACTVTIGADSLTLGCGESGCLSGSRFGCAEDLVMPLGRCDADLGSVSVDNGDGGQCLPPTTSCEGATLSCCGVASDAGLLSPSCDPISRRCCVAAGTTCESSADCCAGHACTLVAGERRCGS